MDLQGLVECLNVSKGHSERECVKILYLNRRRQLIGESTHSVQYSSVVPLFVVPFSARGSPS